MSPKEFAITIQCLWEADVGKTNLDQIVIELLEFLVLDKTENKE